MSLTIEDRRTVSTRLGEVQVAAAGSGPVDLIVITPIGVAWMERALPEAMQELFRVHVVELPGTSAATATSRAATVDGVIATVADVSDAVTHSEPVLFGHSMNGTLVLAAAGEVGCCGVIAVCPAAALPADRAVAEAYWEEKPEEARRERATALIAQHEASTDPAERADIERRFDRLRRWFDPDFDSTDLDALTDLPIEWISSVFESGASISWPDRFSQLSVPVLLGLGEYDFAAPMTAWTADNLPPQATVHVFRRSGHTPFVEEPAEFIDATTRWIRSTHLMDDAPAD